MSALHEIFEAAKQDFRLTYSVYDIEGPQINVDEEFRVQFGIHAASGNFRWNYVALQVFPDLEHVEVTPDQGFEEDTLGGEIVYTKHLPGFDFFRFESIQLRAKARLAYFRAPFCSARVFAKDGHLRVWNAGLPRIYCRTYIGPRMLRCANGHEYPVNADPPYSFCPIDGLPLE